MRHHATMGVAGHVAARTLVLIAAVLAALVFSTVANLTATARGAEPFKAVVIVGPAHSATSNYLAYGRTIADAAEANGMTVARVFHPNATWARVKAETLGAKLVVYLGHGFGWPSPYPYNLFESQMDGLGLNWPDEGRRGSGDVHYYGGDKVRASLRLGQNAVVILNHLCYSAGFGESGQSAPSQSVAIQRVDNFAAAFLAVGASNVFALAYQPGETVVEWLLTKHETMEDVFRRRHTGFGDSYGGWVGWNPTYHDSTRTEGARILLDPHRTQSYRRALTGNLQLTTDEWRGSSDPDDVTAPAVTGFVGVPSAGATLASGGTAPIITPNNDGISDTLQLGYTLSERAYLDFVVRDSADQVVRRFSVYGNSGSGTNSWNGKNDAGTGAPDGRYDIFVTPRDLAGNVGERVDTPVKVMRAMKSPASAPSFFFARDGDTLAASTSLSVTMTTDATLSWTVVDASDNVVRNLMNEDSVTAGVLTRTWDGRNQSGEYVPDGKYRQVLTATTERGTYSHTTNIVLGAFKLTAPVWSGSAGTKVTFTMTAAEAVSGWPAIYVYQPDLARFRASPVKYSSKQFKFTVTLKSGGSAGQVRINMKTTDTGGGTQSQNAFFTLQ